MKKTLDSQTANENANESMTPRPRISLRRERIKVVSVRTGVRTGRGSEHGCLVGMDSLTIDCH